MYKASRKYIEGLTQALHDETGIKFQEGKGWSVDIKTRTLTYDMNSFTDMNYLDAKGLIIHEVGHLKHTKDNSKPTKLEQDNPDLQEVYNVFEDMRIENKLIKEYGDFAKEALHSIGQTAMSDLLTQQQAGKLPKLFEAMVHILNKNLRGARYSESWEEPSYIDYQFLTDSTKFHNNSCDDVKKFIGDNDINIDQWIRETKQLDNVKDLKEYVNDYIYPKVKHLFENKPRSQSLSDVLRKTKRPQQATESDSRQAKIPTDKEINDLLYLQINTLQSKLKATLQENKATRYKGSYKRGRLLSKNTYKVLTDDTRIFSKRNKPDIPDYHIIFILDESGSMQGKRHANAYMASYMLDVVVKKLGFTVTYIKYNDNVRLMKDLKEYRQFNGGGNNDFDVITEAYKRLNKDKQNIIFMLTDGGVCQDPSDIVQKIVKQRIPLFAIGVGLNETDTKLLNNYYPNPISVTKLEELPSVLIRCISRVIHR